MEEQVKLQNTVKWHVKSCVAFEKKVRELEQKLADSNTAFEEANTIIGKLEQDSERLDWLEEHKRHDVGGDAVWQHMDKVLMGYPEAMNLRQAIDHLMAKAKGE